VSPLRRGCLQPRPTCHFPWHWRTGRFHRQLSTYVVFIDGESNPVSHMPRTITNSSASDGSCARSFNPCRASLERMCGCSAGSSAADPVITTFTPPVASSVVTQSGRIRPILVWSGGDPPRHRHGHRLACQHPTAGLPGPPTNSGRSAIDLFIGNLEPKTGRSAPKYAVGTTSGASASTTCWRDQRPSACRAAGRRYSRSSTLLGVPDYEDVKEGSAPSMPPSHRSSLRIP
jgi:hypothetical protein